MIHPLVLLTAVLHTLLLLVHLYSCAFRRLGRGLPLSPADLALLIVQTAALTLLRAAGDDPLSAPGMVVQLLLLILCALAVVLELRRSRACGGELLPQSVREAIDSLPDGLCFAAPDGRPILVNTRMHALIAGLTGAALLDANAVWSRLKELAQPADPWTAQVEGEVLDLLCPDGSRWRFRRELLRDRLPHMVQLTAWEVSRLWALSRRLYENNRALEDQHRRLRTLLGNMVELNREKEVLAFKTRLHNEFGQCLLTTRRQLEAGLAAGQLPALTQLWRQAIRRLAGIPAAMEEHPEGAPQAELARVAQLIGCQLEFRGGERLPRQAMSLVCAAAREALTNGVRHAGATGVTVAVSPAPSGFHVEIWDNGHKPVPSLTEGEGLGNLRKKLEREGVLFRIRCGRGVRLILDIPATRPGHREEGLL